MGLTALGMVLFTSCEEETKPAPVISFTNNVSSAETSNSSYTITGTITTEVGLDQVKYFAVTEAGSDQLAVVTYFDNKNEYSFQFAVNNITDDVTIQVEATDADNQTTSRNFEITFIGGGNAISSFTAVLMGAQSLLTTGSALDADAGTVYKLDDAATNAAKVDILYYYGTTNLATFAAPNDETVNGVAANAFNWTNNWSVQNATKFGVSTLSTTEFDAIADDSELATIAGLAASKITDLGVDDVLEFITAGGKKGALKVTAITTGASGTITINVKVQL